MFSNLQCLLKLSITRLLWCYIFNYESNKIMSVFVFNCGARIGVFLASCWSGWERRHCSTLVSLVSLAIQRVVLMSPCVTFHQGFVTTKIFVPLLFTFYQAMLEIDSWDGLVDGCLKMVVCSCPCHPLSHLNTNIFTWIYTSCHQTHRWLQTNKELQHINVKVDSVKQ